MAKKILLADDSITIQKVVELTFAEGDYQVICASDGAQAIRKIEESAPDIALVDIMMPLRNGYDVCAHIKEDPRLAWIPVMLLTGTFEPFDPRRAEQVGANGHIVKPFESRSLVSQVENLIAENPRPGSEKEPEPIAPSTVAGETEVVNSGQIFVPGAISGDEAGARIHAGDPGPSTVRLDSRAFFSQFALGEDVVEAPPPGEMPTLGALDLGASSSQEPTISMKAVTAGTPAVSAGTRAAMASARTDPPPMSAGEIEQLTRERIEEIARPLVKEAVDRVIREIAWEVIPEVAEAIVARRLRELEDAAESEADPPLH